MRARNSHFGLTSINASDIWPGRDTGTQRRQRAESNASETIPVFSCSLFSVSPFLFRCAAAQVFAPRCADHGRGRRVFAAAEREW